MGAFQFVVLSTLRAAQLMRGCTPRIDVNGHKPIVVAQLEVAAGAVGDAHVASVPLAHEPSDAVEDHVDVD